MSITMFPYLNTSNMIFDITPFRSDKNIGKAYNERIALLPDDAWIIIRDGDCMYLTPDYGNIIEGIIERYGNEYSLIGALTNRLGEESLLYNKKFSEETDIYPHYHIAESIKDNWGIEETNLCAGFFMMFRKDTWRRCGYFQENTYLADRMFSNKVLELGGKIGIAQNLYLFHGYRIWERDHQSAWKSVNHLK